VPVVEIFEPPWLGWRVIHARLAAHHHDPSAMAANSIEESIDERKMPDVIDHQRKLGTVTPRWARGVGALRIRDDGIERAGKLADRIRRKVDGGEIGKVAGNRRRRSTRGIACRPSILVNSRQTDDVRTIGNERLHYFESNAAVASGHDHSLAVQIDAGQHLISG
jgi:hypothetical protein